MLITTLLRMFALLFGTEAVYQGAAPTAVKQVMKKMSRSKASAVPVSAKLMRRGRDWQRVAKPSLEEVLARRPALDEEVDAQNAALKDAIALAADGSHMKTKALIESMGKLVDLKSLDNLTGEALSMTLMNGYHAELTLFGLSKISKDPKFASMYRVFCLDDEAYKICTNKLGAQVCSRTMQTFAEASDFKVKQFNQIGLLKLRLGLELLGHVPEVAIYDGDVAHMQFSQKLDHDTDFMYQQEGATNNESINIGQMLLRDVPDVIALLQKVLSRESGWDQQLVNDFRALVPKRKPLPMSLYAALCLRQLMGAKPITFHANCCTGDSHKLRELQAVVQKYG